LRQTSRTPGTLKGALTKGCRGLRRLRDGKIGERGQRHWQDQNDGFLTVERGGSELDRGAFSLDRSDGDGTRSG